MPAVRLMDSANRAGVFLLPGIGDLCGIVFRRAIVNDDDFNIVATFIACKERLYAGVHIGRRVVARNGERDCLHAKFPPKPPQRPHCTYIDHAKRAYGIRASHRRYLIELHYMEVVWQ